MRGAERPAKVAWTHPFLPPLQSLPDEAARQTFIDITDHHEEEKEKKKALRQRGQMMGGRNAASSA
jgi:hypothetical protein